jgi:hypothetical protein
MNMCTFIQVRIYIYIYIYIYIGEVSVIQELKFINENLDIAVYV